MINYASYFFKHIKYDKDSFSRFKDDVLLVGELIFRHSTGFTYCHPNPYEMEFIELIDGNGFQVRRDKDMYIINIIYD